CQELMAVAFELVELEFAQTQNLKHRTELCLNLFRRDYRRSLSRFVQVARVAGEKEAKRSRPSHLSQRPQKTLHILPPHRVIATAIKEEGKGTELFRQVQDVGLNESHLGVCLVGPSFCLLDGKRAEIHSRDVKSLLCQPKGVDTGATA